MHFNKEKTTLNLLQVLRTIPWARVDIELVSVETDLAGRVMEGSRGDIIQYMGDQGYIHRAHHTRSGVKNGNKDDLFIRKDVVDRLIQYSREKLKMQEVTMKDEF